MSGTYKKVETTVNTLIVANSESDPIAECFTIKNADLVVDALNRNEILKGVENILFIVRSAVNKIEIEKMRGADYRHSQVDALLEQNDEISTLISKLRESRR